MRLEDKEIEQIVGENKGGAMDIVGGSALEDILERQKMPLFLLGAAVFLLGIGVAIVKGDRGNQPRTTQGAGFGNQGVVFETEERDKSDKSVALEEGPILVDVSGAVERPGVYELGGGARVKDALVAAGGLGRLADREFVARSMNLAAPIRDGAKVYIPEIGETSEIGTSVEGNITGVSANNSGLVNINTASSGELEKLQGIGPVRAQEIIDNRQYGSVEELRTKGILGPKTFEKIRDSIIVY